MSSKSTTPASTKGLPAQTRSTKLRILLFGLPILAGWAVIIHRRTSSTAAALPSSYSLCSSPHQLQIYTLDPAQPWVECVAVQDGLLAHVGSLEDVRAQYGDRQTTGGGLKMFRMKRGQMALPGLIDSHAHLLQYGEGVAAADLVGASSVQDVIERLAAYIAREPGLLEDKSRIILGLGWDQTKWAGAAFPTAGDLEADPRLARRPIWLKRIDVSRRCAGLLSCAES